MRTGPASGAWRPRDDRSRFYLGPHRPGGGSGPPPTAPQRSGILGVPPCGLESGYPVVITGYHFLSSGYTDPPHPACAAGAKRLLQHIDNGTAAREGPGRQAMTRG